MRSSTPQSINYGRDGDPVAGEKSLAARSEDRTAGVAFDVMPHDNVPYTWILLNVTERAQ
jgi:hypothetical protein